jgi:DNA-binding NarL/FixJ family response regulator
VPRATASASLPRAASAKGALIALVGASDRCERASAILAAEGMRCASFADVEALNHGAGAAVATLIVHRAEEDETSLAHQIEPLRAVASEARVVLICGAVQRWEVRAALAAGVDGVVMEDELGEALVPCLRAVQAGQICVPRRHGPQIEPPALSTREKQILGLVVMGYMNSQIAEQLYLAESTVKSHLSSAFGKLGVRSRNEAVNLILDSKRGLGMGILALGGEPLQPTTTVAG